MGGSFEPEQNMLILLIAIISFLLTNFNERLGMVYIALSLLFYVIIDDNPFIKYRLFKTAKPEWLTIIAITLIAYVAYYFSSGFIINLVFQQAANFGLGALALEQSKIIQLLAVDLLIPIIETMVFFVMLPQVYAKVTNTNLDEFSTSMIIGVLLLSAAFTLFHLTTRGISNGPGLATSFLFAIVSIGLVLWRKQGAEAVGIHIINNMHASGIFTGAF